MTSKKKIVRHHVKAKQPNSKMCLVCGLKNSAGLQASFYELEDKSVLATFQPLEEHQGYPGRLHGGIATAIIDETIARAVMPYYAETIWGVTVDFSIRFKKPIPLDEEVRVISRITKDMERRFEGTGEIVLRDGTIAAEGRGIYIKLPIEKIADFDIEAQEWSVVPTEYDPTEVEI